MSISLVSAYYSADNAPRVGANVSLYDPDLQPERRIPVNGRVHSLSADKETTFVILDDEPEAARRIPTGALWRLG